MINESLRGLRRRRRELLADPGYLDGVLLDGTARATATAAETLHRVRRAMGMDYLRYGSGDAAMSLELTGYPREH